MSIAERIAQTLEEIGPSLKQLTDPHYLIGASALILSGIPLEKTADIDLLTSKRDAVALQRLWAHRAVADYQPTDGDKFRSAFGRYSFGVMDVEVMGGLEVFCNDKWQPLTIDTSEALKGSSLRLPTLEAQKIVLQVFGRPKDLERIRLIEAHLTK